MSDPGFGRMRKFVSMLQSLNGEPSDFETNRFGEILMACQSFEAVISISAAY